MNVARRVGDRKPCRKCGKDEAIYTRTSSDVPPGSQDFRMMRAFVGEGVARPERIPDSFAWVCRECGYEERVVTEHERRQMMRYMELVRKALLATEEYRSFECDECRAILRALRDAHERDQQELRKHLVDTAESSGRGVEEMGFAWVFSVARMPNDEMSTIMRLHYPLTAQARRKLAEHEAETGHSIYRYGWGGPYGIR